MHQLGRTAATTCVAIYLATTNAFAQSPPVDSSATKPGGKTTTLPLTYPRSAKFTTDEGTWMSLDVSPDGRTIVFDLVGDLYMLPITGGNATRITDGPGFDAQPRFSPDGKRIVFLSDRNGSDELYTVDPTGQRVEQLKAVGDKRDGMSPVWTADGQNVVLVAHGFIVFSVAGGAGTKLTLSPSDVKPGATAPQGIVGVDFTGPAISRDSRFLYYSMKDRLGDFTDVKDFIWKVQRYDFETGKQDDVAAPRVGGAVRPVVSPDGKWLVYGTREDTVTSLRVMDLQTRQDKWLIHNVQHDDVEAAHSRDMMPGSAFTPDGKSLITSFNGKIWRVDVPSGKATMIPFTADVDVQLGKLVRFEYPINDSALTVSQIRDPRLSPDNRRVVFTALDRVYVMDLPNGAPRRLTNSRIAEHEPVWSPDGQWIAYATWDGSKGDVLRVRSGGRGEQERVSRQTGYYRRVNYNPSGSRLIVWRADQAPYLGRSPEAAATLVWLPTTGGGGQATEITSLGAGPNEPTPLPYFVNGDSTRIYLGKESVRWDGTERKQHLRYDAIDWGPVFSPDGARIFKQIGVFDGLEVALRKTPLIRSVAFELTPAGLPMVGRKVGGFGMQFPAWSADGKKLSFAAGRFLFIYDVARGDSATADSISRAEARSQQKEAKPSVSADTVPRAAYQAERIEVKIVVPKDRPAGVIALRNARIVTMRGDEVIERGDVVVTNNRITAVGVSGAVSIPRDAKVMDLAGTTIIPGLVDVHAHPHEPKDLHARPPWPYAAALAHGVTTSRDPQSGTTDVLTYRDLVDVGDIIGPRIFSTGPGINGAFDVSTLDKARDIMHAFAQYYATNTVKQYQVGDRKRRQTFLIAANEYQLSPTLEGGRDFKLNLIDAIDGYAGSEHAYPIVPLFRDVVEVIARSGVTNTPTLLVDYAGPQSENYMYEKYAYMHDDPKLQRFVPRSELDRRFLRRQSWFADNQYAHEKVSAQSAKIVRAGGRVGLGGHGQLPGLGDQWELWLLQSGGMTPLEALRCATLFGAQSVGLGRDLGSLELGKLADLVVLDKNPLEDIHNSAAIRYVMKNGRLYDGNTLDELWPRERTFGRQWWQEDK